ncbi:MAG: hypothetical protein PQ975_03320 [Methanobacterium sp.]|jgi:hypothetical protein
MAWYVRHSFDKRRNGDYQGQQLSASVPAPASMQLSAEKMQTIRGRAIKIFIGIKVGEMWF